MELGMEGLGKYLCGRRDSLPGSFGSLGFSMLEYRLNSQGDWLPGSSHISLYSFCFGAFSSLWGYVTEHGMMLLTFLLF
ncbi:Uncharacterized protein TCM_016441 [Theobroma cacao]|uniref:Uncharacterized protein n=1 Tax=Theobroma cacao TaxID=3641 RepID=A0A061G552_THECC|nr:Uncharacterized protein TCM_016441 [Theobroma cacao]